MKVRQGLYELCFSRYSCIDAIQVKLLTCLIARVRIFNPVKLFTSSRSSRDTEPASTLILRRVGLATHRAISVSVNGIVLHSSLIPAKQLA